MNIIIDTRMVNENLHGIARYTYELVKGLANLRDVQITVMTNDEKLTKQVFKETYDKIKILKIKSKFLSLFEQFELPYVLNKYDKDTIFHSPSFVASPFIRLKTVMTIHDLNHIKLPQYYSKFHQHYYKYIVKPSALKANKIITVSNFSKGEIVEWLGCDDDKVVVTYNGIDEKFKPIDDEKMLSSCRQKYNLPDEFVLYIGNQKPHKNVKTLVKAMKDVESDIKLVMNGKPNEELQFLINEELKIKDRVQFIGYVDDDDLPLIYNLACVFVFPSLYEGFGLPPLEAMACDCISIVSNIPSLVEVAGDRAIVVDPHDAQKISKCIIEIMENELGFISKEENVKFSWKKMVSTTNMVYKNI